MKRLILALLGLVLASGLALAQPVGQNALSGSECWNAGQGPGGPSTGFLCVNIVRNGTALLVVPSVTGNPVTTLTQSNSTVYWVGTAPTTWTINLPSPAFDGEVVTVGTDTTLTSLVTIQVATGSGQTLNSTFTSQTISTITSVEYQFSAGTAKWYRLR